MKWIKSMFSKLLLSQLFVDYYSLWSKFSCEIVSCLLSQTERNSILSICLWLSDTFSLLWVLLTSQWAGKWIKELMCKMWTAMLMFFHKRARLALCMGHVLLLMVSFDSLDYLSLKAQVTVCFISLRRYTTYIQLPVLRCAQLQNFHFCVIAIMLKRFMQTIWLCLIRCC